MLLPSMAIVGGLLLLVWSAERFIEGAAATAGHFGMSPLLIGMLIVGFGTSAPEMLVSAIAATEGKPELALGNALGSNIVNTGLILGLTALIAPITVQSALVRRELPLLVLICLLLGALLWDHRLSLLEVLVLLAGFASLIAWTLYAGLRSKGDTLAQEAEAELAESEMSLGKAVGYLVFGLLLLVLSSRVLVWGAVSIAQSLGVSDLIIGLTIIALGTSLPELAASIVAARRGEHDIAIGNIVGSNMFNILAVIGIAGLIAPIESIPTAVLMRDWAVMLAMTLALLVMAYGFGRQGRINRVEGALLLLSFVAYNVWLLSDTLV